MKKVNYLKLLLLLLAVFVGVSIANAATSPNLNMANSFAILASTYTNTSAGTNITGDLGYTTGPAVMPTITGNTFVANSVYNQAGIDQNSALTSLNQPCTYSFPVGSIDLSTDNSRSGPAVIGVYTPGVYCINGSASIGTAGITFSGTGTYIFRMTGALTSVDNSIASLTGGASACDIWFTPGAATTLGANTSFSGNIIDAAGITIGNLSTWSGKALAFGGTVTTNNNTITVPSTCGTMPMATLTLIKTVTNDNGGTAVPTNWTLSANGPSIVSGLTGTASTTNFLVNPGTYTLGEGSGPQGYTAGIYSCVKNGGAANSSDTISLVAGDKAVCTINNNDNSSSTGSGVIYNRIVPRIHITKTPSQTVLPLGSTQVVYTYVVDNQNSVPLRDVKISDNKCAPVNYISGDLNNDSILSSDEKWTYTCVSNLKVTTTNIATVIGYDYGGLSATDTASATVVVLASTPVIVTTATTSSPAVIVTTSPKVPKLPNTGFNPQSNFWDEIIPSIILISLFAFYAVKRKQKI